MSDFITGTGQRLTNIHSPEQCKGSYCPIHNPSDHHMKDWPLHWREDRGFFERICKHGVGHPDPDDVVYHDKHGVDIGVHGCDGCCLPPKKQFLDKKEMEI